MIPVKPVIEADLLIVGGGIGGLMAGHRGGQGRMQERRHHGKVPCAPQRFRRDRQRSLQLLYPFLSRRRHRAVFKETMQSLVGQLKEPSLMHKFLEKSFELVQ